MDLNADFTVRACVHAGELDWVASPIPGVDRRMLDRIGDEVARATSIVRYAPGSHFSPHTHGGGEEFLVLDGVFQDEHGDFPAGCYIRNPPTTRHTPGSEPGCTIFVKLWQFNAEDRTQVRLDTASRPFAPVSDRPGVTAQALFEDEREQVRLECWSPGARIMLPAVGGLELLVLDGSFIEGDEMFKVQSWLRLQPGACLTATAGPQGCRVWAKSGHLETIAELPSFATGGPGRAETDAMTPSR
jgi:anti-sigma factor ChrR (cupin superfamily)